MSGNAIDTTAFVASGRDSQDEVESVVISRRSTGSDAVRLQLRHVGRALLARFELVDRDLSNADVEVLFRECYLREYTSRYYADKVDRIELVALDGSVEFEVAHP